MGREGVLEWCRRDSHGGSDIIVEVKEREEGENKGDKGRREGRKTKDGSELTNRRWYKWRRGRLTGRDRSKWMGVTDAIGSGHSARL